ncbi:hypothetical protein ACWD25_57290 [Streptomyces sp. NPDC002920]
MPMPITLPKNALRDSLIAVCVAGLLPLLAACGGGDSSADGSGDGKTAAGSTGDAGTKTVDGAVQLNIPEGVDADTKKQYIQENAIAACMRKQGFSYTPHVAAAGMVNPNHDGDGADYALAKKFRQKWGFGTYAAAAYPDDPNAPFSNAGGKVGGKSTTPLDDDQKGMTPAQLKAYDAALYGPPAKTKAEERDAGCSLEGTTAAYGAPASAEQEKKKQNAKNEENRQNGLALNGDPELVQLAQDYAACLKREGIEPSTTQPTGMATVVRIDLSNKLPENSGDLTKEQAVPLLTADIDIALKDLECGKKFRAAYFPKEKAHPYWGAGV